jgi:hypothetical protein
MIGISSIPSKFIFFFGRYIDILRMKKKFGNYTIEKSKTLKAIGAFEDSNDK